MNNVYIFFDEFELFCVELALILAPSTSTTQASLETISFVHNSIPLSR